MRIVGLTVSMLQADAMVEASVAPTRPSPHASARDHSLVDFDFDPDRARPAGGVESGGVEDAETDGGESGSVHAVAVIAHVCELRDAWMRTHMDGHHHPDRARCLSDLSNAVQWMLAHEAASSQAPPLRQAFGAWRHGWGCSFRFASMYESRCRDECARIDKLYESAFFAK